jgi:hypothetical protein
MRVESQGNSECMLATIAALADRSLAEVREYACDLAGVRKWSRVCNTIARTRAGKPTFWSVVPKVAQHFGGDGLLALVDMRWESMSASAGGVTTSKLALPAIGRGTVRVVYRERAGRSGHIMPWADGLIYDPASIDPSVGVTLEKYLEFHPYYRVDYLRSLTVAGNPEDCTSPSPDLGY